MNRAERRFEMKSNKTNSRREGEKKMNGMKGMIKMNVVNEVRELHEKLVNSLEFRGNVNVPDEMIIAIHNLLEISGSVKEYVKLMVLHDDYLEIMQNMLQMVDKINGSHNSALSYFFNRNADALAGMYIAVVLTLVKERYAEGILQEIIAEIQEYELTEDAEERMDLICTLVMPEDDLQAAKTFQALLSGNAQSFVEELDILEAMLGIKR